MGREKRSVVSELTFGFSQVEDGGDGKGKVLTDVSRRLIGEKLEWHFKHNRHSTSKLAPSHPGPEQAQARWGVVRAAALGKAPLEFSWLGDNGQVECVEEGSEFRS